MLFTLFTLFSGKVASHTVIDTGSIPMRAIRTHFRFSHQDYDTAQLAKMQLGGDKLLTATLALQARQHNVLSKLLPKTGHFMLWDHYPEAEVIDSTHASQYYYHSHRTSAREL